MTTEHAPAPTGTVDVVIVTNTGPTATSACLESLQSHGTERLGRIVVVDNGIVDRPQHVAATSRADLYGPGDIRVIRTTNRGYGAAINLGVASLDDDDDQSGIVVALNDDVTVTDHWLDSLIDGFTDDLVGAVQPKLMHRDVDTIDSLGVELDRFGAGHDIGHGQPDHVSPSGPIEIFTGGAVALRRRFLAAVGGFDERFFLYYEDVDLALRGAELGWTYRCQMDSVVLHAKGASTIAMGDDLRRLQERNRLWVAIRFGSCTLIRHAVWLSLRRLRHRPRRAHLSALLQGLAAAPRLVTARRRGGGAQ